MHSFLPYLKGNFHIRSKYFDIMLIHGSVFAIYVALFSATTIVDEVCGRLEISLSPIWITKQ